MKTASFEIDHTESFPKLALPPIVEAVIEWQAKATHSLDADAIASLLKSSLPEFSCQPIHEVKFLNLVPPDNGEPVSTHEKGWRGFRLTSQDGVRVVQFKRDGVAVSRLKPYESWHSFSAEATRIWNVYLQAMRPVEVQRLGVRYINQFEMTTADALDQLLNEPPTCPAGLPLVEFVYQSTFAVPNRPYGVRVIKVMQAKSDSTPEASGLFLDCDAYSTKPIACEPQPIESALKDLQWIKNKVFFSLIRGEVIQTFR